MSVKKSSQLTLHDRLSRLTLQQAAKWLGPEGARLLKEAGKSTVQIEPTDVSWPDARTLQVLVRSATGEAVVVTLTLGAGGRDGVRWLCSEQREASSWVAEVLTFVLEEKTTLGLAVAPADEQDLPLEHLDEAALERRALAEREQRAREEKMEIKRIAGGGRNGKGPWCDYLVTSALSGKTWRVALRGLGRGESFCACPDFRKNTLGTCKHVMKVTAWARKRHTAAEMARRWQPEQLAIHMRYDGEPRLALEAPAKLAPEIAKLVEPWRDRCAVTIDETAELFALVRKIESCELRHSTLNSQLSTSSVLVFPDAEERIGHALHRRRLAGIVAEIRKNPASHPLRTTLLNTELLPYQLDGIAFAAGAGRAVLADEMGLGKTI